MSQSTGHQMLSGQSLEAAAQAAGHAGLQDGSSGTAKLRAPTPQLTIDQIIGLRRQRWTG
ncbi:MAG: hypothetical protein AAF850_13435 [Pseudomonadota bacterium]